MDAKALFQAISSKMHADFKASAQVSHHGSKGTIRENILRKFLEEGRLPSKYGIGSGEIVGRVKDTSRQSDLIIYDKIDGVTLLYDEHTQVYPIDCVYGIIEVKSGLSKAEFIDALDKIAAFKSMAPGGHVQQSIGGVTASFPRPRPFGMIFAYGLATNSLASLTANLREWEQRHPPELWPNYICILGVGIISHQGKEAFQKCLDSESITTASWPMSLEYKEDSLWIFYSTALAKLPGVRPQDAFVVGDTPYDMEAARTCGIPALALCSGGFADEALEQAGASVIYDDVAALLADYDSSPLGLSA